MAASQSTSRTDFVFMLVALYFILISFFIILSTLSVRDSEKLQHAVSSVSEKFKLNGYLVNDKTQATSTPNKSEKAQEASSYGAFLDQIQSWIGNLYSLGNVNISRRGSEISITIHHPNFFDEGSLNFSDDAKRAMLSLSELLTNWQSDYISELEVVADEPADRSKEGDDRMRTSAGHAGAIAAYLVQHGISPTALSVTMRDNPEATMSFTFIIRVPPKAQP